MADFDGLAKTRTIKTLSRHAASDFSRIQFTPDLRPSDVTGTEVYYSEGDDSGFVFQPGPIFGNLILADEINRAPAKVQTALLEAMEERQVTVSGKTHQLPDLFMVLATQNPIEQEGPGPGLCAQYSSTASTKLPPKPTVSDAKIMPNFGFLCPTCRQFCLIGPGSDVRSAWRQGWSIDKNRSRWPLPAPNRPARPNQ